MEINSDYIIFQYTDSSGKFVFQTKCIKVCDIKYYNDYTIIASILNLKISLFLINLK